MKIQKIRPQKRNKSRSSIFCDDEFKFGLSNEIIIKYDLKEGDEISKEQINVILNQEEKTKIRNRAYRILMYRERSSKELRDRLLKIGFDNNLVSEVIDDLLADKTLDDERFARAFTRNYTNLKPKGNVFLDRELRKKGISLETIQMVLKTRDEHKLICDYISQHCADLDIKVLKERQKVVNRLLRRGFSSNIVYEVVNTYQGNDEK